MSRIALSLVVATGLALPLAAQADVTSTTTTQNGTVIDGTYSCSSVNGVYTCTRDAQWTGGGTNGYTGDRTRSWTFTPGQGNVQVDLSGTRFNGNTFNRSHTRSSRRDH